MTDTLLRVAKFILHDRDDTKDIAALAAILTSTAPIRRVTVPRFAALDHPDADPTYVWSVVIEIERIGFIKLLAAAPSNLALAFKIGSIAVTTPNELQFLVDLLDKTPDNCPWSLRELSFVHFLNDENVTQSAQATDTLRRLTELAPSKAPWLRSLGLVIDGGAPAMSMSNSKNAELIAALTQKRHMLGRLFLDSRNAALEPTDLAALLQSASPSLRTLGLIFPRLPTAAQWEELNKTKGVSGSGGFLPHLEHLTMIIYDNNEADYDDGVSSLLQEIKSSGAPLRRLTLQVQDSFVGYCEHWFASIKPAASELETLRFTMENQLKSDEEDSTSDKRQQLFKHAVTALGACRNLRFLSVTMDNKGAVPALVEGLSQLLANNNGTLATIDLHLHSGDRGLERPVNLHVSEKLFRPASSKAYNSLRSLTLTGSFTSDDFSALATRLPNLELLTLSSAVIDDALHDAIKAAETPFPRLSRLFVRYSRANPASLAAITRFLHLADLRVSDLSSSNSSDNSIVVSQGNFASLPRLAFLGLDESFSRPQFDVARHAIINGAGPSLDFVRLGCCLSAIPPQCNRVRHLELYGAFQTVFPDLTPSLLSLQHIDFDGCDKIQFSDANVAMLARCTRLTELILDRCHVGARFCDIARGLAAGCESLELLKLNFCGINSVQGLERLPRLRTLEIDDNPDLTDISCLAASRSLRVIKCDSFRSGRSKWSEQMMQDPEKGLRDATKVAALAAMPRLEELFLSKDIKSDVRRAFKHAHGEPRLVR